MKYKLSDVCTIKYGKDHKRLSDGKIPVYGSGGIIRYADTALYNKKSVLIPRKGTLDNLFFVSEPFWTVDTLFYTEINETKAVPEYLYYFLKTLDLAGMNVGTAVPSLTTAVLNEIEIDVPPIAVQQTIAATLSVLDDKIENNRKINHHLEQIAQTLYLYWMEAFTPFSNVSFIESPLGKIPKGWHVAPLSDIADFFSGYSYKGAELLPSETAMATIKNFERSGGFKLDGFKEIIPSKCKKDHFVNLFDILVAHTDLTQKAEVIGNAEILLSKAGYKSIIASMDLVRVVAKKASNQFILAQILRSQRFKSYALGYVNGTTVLHLSKKALPNFLVPFPHDTTVLSKFGDTLQQIYLKIASIIEETSLLIDLRDTLLPRLISGELSVDNLAAK